MPSTVTDRHHTRAGRSPVQIAALVEGIVHLLFDVARIALARSPGGARAFLLFGGLIYLALFLYGMFIDLGSSANFVPLNDADNWLHLGLGLGMVGLSFLPHPVSSDESVRP